MGVEVGMDVMDEDGDVGDGDGSGALRLPLPLGGSSRITIP